MQIGAEDLRIKLEADYSPQPPTSNTTPSTPTSLVSYMETNKDGLPTNMASIAPADMLNVWNATKLSSKSGTVNTADGKQSIVSTIFVFCWNISRILISAYCRYISFISISMWMSLSKLLTYFFYFFGAMSSTPLFLVKFKWSSTQTIKINGKIKNQRKQNEHKMCMKCRQKIEVSILRTIIRLWNQSARSHSATSSRHPCTMSVLYKNIYA